MFDAPAAAAPAPPSREPSAAERSAPVLAVAARGGARRKLVPIAAGAAVLLVVGIVFATRGGGNEASPPPKTAARERAVARPADVAPPSSPPAPVEPPATTDEGTVEPPADPTPPAVTPPPVKPRRANTLAGKQVVLEYDTPARETPKAVAKDDAAAIGAARISYSSGNQRLFKGDADGAIRAYRQALAIYPGYVGGYRGLGLAYAQKGDKANALKALRTYLRTVPNARDAALVKKRIAALQKR